MRAGDQFFLLVTSIHLPLSSQNQLRSKQRSCSQHRLLIFQHVYLQQRQLYQILSHVENFPWLLKHRQKLVRRGDNQVKIEGFEHLLLHE